MCGICGIVLSDPNARVNPRVIERMSDAIAHRGPDDDGQYLNGRVGLGFRRLSIIDLSGGHQPMANEDETVWIAYNGEIFNHAEHRAPLEARGHRFRTRSDTEAIVHLYEEHGSTCPRELRGMFGFAIWDEKRKALLLARDRSGIKPMFYATTPGGDLIFGSEIKAILASGMITPEVDDAAVAEYFALGTVSGSRTLIRGVKKLEPGHTLTWKDGRVAIERYWSPPAYEPGRVVVRDLAEAADEFWRRFVEAVDITLMSDVPLGVFLSGGLDSSAILATMSKIAGGNRVKTFSVGYEAANAREEDANEFTYARMATNTFACEHREYRLSASEFQEFIPKLVWYLDEPLADPTCIPLYYLSKLARESITVVLSGEGADEILGGYGIYGKMQALNRINRRAPGIGRLARITPWEKLRGYMQMCGQALEERYRGVCRGFNGEGLRRLVGAERCLEVERRQDELFGAHFAAAGRASQLNRMLYVDAKVWLPDDLLMKADRMTMANGLELRVPSTDLRRVFRFQSHPGCAPPCVSLHGTTCWRRIRLAEVIWIAAKSLALYRSTKPAAPTVRRRCGRYWCSSSGTDIL